MIQNPIERTFITALDSAFHVHSLAVTGLLQSLKLSGRKFWVSLLALDGAGHSCCMLHSPETQENPSA